ncbi:MAG TPA: HyaD/HybD family hydrogenase maturation endopeptidase [Deferrimonas sp.]|jgi:hydrogenase maturation protease
MAILVLGLGNSLMNDDAFGGAVVALLQQRYAFPEEVRVVDGGTLGLDLLPFLEGVEQLLIVDAVAMGAPPGTVFRLEGNEVPRAFAGKLSVHQMGLQDLLAVAELQGNLPPTLIFRGVQPGSIEMGMRMSPTVVAALDRVVSEVASDLAAWGAPPRARITVNGG